MNKKLLKDQKIVTTITFVIMSIVVGIIMLYPPQKLDDDKLRCYYTLAINLIIFIAVWYMLFLKARLDMFEPIVIVSVVHVLLFEVTPLICLATYDFSWFAQEPWSGCVKGTWISTLGYLCIIFAYFLNEKRSGNNFEFTDEPEHQSFNFDVQNSGKLLMYMLVIWFAAFLCNMFILMQSGKSIMYILTLRSSVNQDMNDAASSAFGFLGIFAYAMIPSFIYVFQLSNSRILKAVLFYLTAVTFFVRGFRFILIAVIVAPIMFYYLKKRKRPNALILFLVIVILLYMVGILDAVRSDIRAGNGLAQGFQSAVTVKRINSVVVNNFSIFKTYYLVVERIPSIMNYTHGRQIFLYTLVMFIPRFIWPGKPQPILRKVIQNSVSSYAVVAGTAYPYIGEYYHEFGIAGVVVMCIVFGVFLKKLRVYMLNEDIHSLVLYSTIFPLLLQILIRGYTPSNFYMIIIVILPVLFAKRFFKKQEARGYYEEA